MFLAFVFLGFAFLILFVSILRSASVKYTFSQKNPTIMVESINQNREENGGIVIDYNLAYAGPVLPDSIFWPLKVLRDRVWLVLVYDISKKAELNLLFADKRLQAARELFSKGESELAYSTLVRSLGYFKTASDLEIIAREKNYDTLDLSETIAKASLKHRQILDELIDIAPEEIRPKITVIEDTVNEIYKSKSEVISSYGKNPPFDPFDGLQ